MTHYEIIEEKERRAKKRIVILGLLIITIVAITGAYAFFTAVFTGVEEDTTITIGAGRLGLHMDGGNTINMQNIYPRAEAWETKRFTITGNNNSALEMEYELSLIVTENTFSNNALTYTLESQNTTNDGTPMPSITSQRGIPTGAGVHSLGQGIFNEPGNEMVHTYYLTFFFPSRGVAQNEDQGATFRAHVGVADATNQPAQDPFIMFEVDEERNYTLNHNIPGLTYTVEDNDEYILNGMLLTINTDIDNETFDEIFFVSTPSIWTFWILNDTNEFQIILFEMMGM